MRFAGADCITAEEQKLIEQAVLADRRPKMFGIVLCLYTGLRIGELLALEWSDVSLEELARTLYLSPKQVSRIIRKEYGCSFPALLKKHRFTTACMLLKYTDLPVSQIASEVEYTYENYFFAQFKGTYGITPLQYRRQNKC